jgi:uncharacterized membrane protein YhaH (DUF805 family)
MISSLTHNLARLVSFHGRDTRALFWPYAGVVFFVVVFGGFVVMTAQMAPFMARMQTYAVAHPDQATITSGPGRYSISIEGSDPEITGAFIDMAHTILGAASLMIVVLVALYATAVVRRLHDGGASGLWGFLPLPFAGFALTTMPRLMESFASPKGPEIGLFFMMFFNNMAYIAALVTLVIFLAKRSDPGINRYGPPTAT